MADCREPREPRPRLPFGIHQAAEYLIGVGVLLASVHAGSGAALVAASGVAVLLLATCTEGPLAAWRVLSPARHRGLDFVLVAVLAATPFVVGGLPAVALATMLVGAATLAWLTVSTRYVRPPRRAPSAPLRGVPRRLGRAVGSRRRPR